MADDLPEISQDLDVPLPQVPPDSVLVPYRTARRLPGQAPIVTTGYGPRAQRQPLMPPSGQGAPEIPDTSRMMRTAFEHLPVDQALKVINAVQQSMGQRLFAKAVQGGMPMPQAFATYGRMMFAGQNMGTSGFTGPPQMTPYQQQSLALRRSADQRAAARATALAQTKPAKEMTEGERMRLALEAQNQMKLGASELATDPSYQSRTNLAQRVLSRVMPQSKATAAPRPSTEETPTPAPPTTPSTTPPTVSERVKVKNKSGKVGTIPKSQLEAAIAEGYTEVK